MKIKEYEFLKKIEAEAPYWSLCGHTCSTVYYRVTNRVNIEKLE